MKTTHEVAEELLALPNVPLLIEGWCRMSKHTLAAEMTDYDPTGAAIIWQKPDDDYSPPKIAGYWEWSDII